MDQVKPTSSGPGYWRGESTGTLAPVVVKYMRGERLTLHEVVIMRAYFRQWINRGDFRGPLVDFLRTFVLSIRSQEDLDKWIEVARVAACDPL